MHTLNKAIHNTPATVAPRENWVAPSQTHRPFQSPVQRAWTQNQPSLPFQFDHYQAFCESARPQFGYALLLSLPLEQVLRSLESDHLCVFLCMCVNVSLTTPNPEIIDVFWRP